MRKFAMFMGSLVALSVAVPAAAQIVGRPVYEPLAPPNPFIGWDSRLPGPSARSEVRGLSRRIERARERGTISRREARQLKREARQIGHLAHRYGRDGLSEAERAELATRAQVLRAAVDNPVRGQRAGARVGQ